MNTINKIKGQPYWENLDYVQRLKTQLLFWLYQDQKALKRDTGTPYSQNAVLRLLQIYKTYVDWM